MKKIRNIIYPLFFTGIVISIFTGCYYDNSEELYPSSGKVCDLPATVSYATDILPIMTKNCAISGCHIGPNPEDGSDLSQYGPLKDYADNGILYSAISHDGTASNMPKDANKLDDCSISIIKSWIDNGSPNN